MIIAIGSDHAGYRLKEQLRQLLQEDGHQVMDVGVYDEQSCDYPDYAARVAHTIVEGTAERGVLVCGTGVGMAIAANKVRGVRAASVSEAVSARLTRSHNDANIVCLGERIVGVETAAEIVRAFMATPFSGGERHQRRVDAIHALEAASPRVAMPLQGLAS